MYIGLDLVVLLLGDSRRGFAPLGLQRKEISSTRETASEADFNTYTKSALCHCLSCFERLYIILASVIRQNDVFFQIFICTCLYGIY